MNATTVVEWWLYPNLHRLLCSVRTSMAIRSYRLSSCTGEMVVVSTSGETLREEFNPVKSSHKVT
jgi:hypothetical protein